MDTAKNHWEILRKVPDELARKVRSFMVVGYKGDGVLMATEDGEGYWLGEMRFGFGGFKQAMEPTRLDVSNLASMAQGHRHILLLNEDGQIHAIGMNDCGQLGLGTDNYETYFSPQLISIPHKVTSVRCGLGHSLALTEDGKVWAWGQNSSGQIGVPKSIANPHSFPHLILELDAHRVVAVECGGHHSLALTDQGEVYAWGENGFGQLGDGSKSSTYTPTRISTPSPVQSMAAGESHTLLLTRTGEVYACGENKCGQLGLPITTEFRSHLVKVAGLPSISQIASHFYVSFSNAMSTDQRCFSWGCLDNNSGIMSKLCPFTFTPFELPTIYSTLDSVLSFRSTLRHTPCSVQVEGPQRTDPETQMKLLTGPTRLGERASRMFDNPDSNSDVKFELGNQSILAHRSVLQISSTHFNRLFSEHSSLAQLNISSTDDLNPPTPIPQSSFNLPRHTTNPSELNSKIIPIFPYSQSPLITISIPDHSYPTFHAYLHFLYTGTLQVPAEHLADLFELAHSHLESDLSKLCLVRMRSTLSLENCCLFYQLTERHPLPEFQQELLHFIADNLLQVFLTAAYQSMDGNLCKKLAISIANLSRQLSNENL